MEAPPSQKLHPEEALFLYTILTKIQKDHRDAVLGQYGAEFKDLVRRFGSSFLGGTKLKEYLLQFPELFSLRTDRRNQVLISLSKDYTEEYKLRLEKDFNSLEEPFPLADIRPECKPKELEFIARVKELLNDSNPLTLSSLGEFYRAVRASVNITLQLKDYLSLFPQEFLLTRRCSQNQSSESDYTLLSLLESTRNPNSICPVCELKIHPDVLFGCRGSLFLEGVEPRDPGRRCGEGEYEYYLLPCNISTTDDFIGFVIHVTRYIAGNTVSAGRFGPAFKQLMTRIGNRNEDFTLGKFLKKYKDIFVLFWDETAKSLMIRLKNRYRIRIITKESEENDENNRNKDNASHVIKHPSYSSASVSYKQALSMPPAVQPLDSSRERSIHCPKPKKLVVGNGVIREGFINVAGEAFKSTMSILKHEESQLYTLSPGPRLDAWMDWRSTGRKKEVEAVLSNNGRYDDIVNIRTITDTDLLLTVLERTNISALVIDLVEVSSVQFIQFSVLPNLYDVASPERTIDKGEVFRMEMNAENAKIREVLLRIPKDVLTVFYGVDVAVAMYRAFKVSLSNMYDCQLLLELLTSVVCEKFYLLVYFFTSNVLQVPIRDTQLLVNRLELAKAAKNVDYADAKIKMLSSIAVHLPRLHEFVGLKQSELRDRKLFDVVKEASAEYFRRCLEDESYKKQPLFLFNPLEAFAFRSMSAVLSNALLKNFGDELPDMQQSDLVISKDITELMGMLPESLRETCMSAVSEDTVELCFDAFVHVKDRSGWRKVCAMPVDLEMVGDVFENIECTQHRVYCARVNNRVRSIHIKFGNSVVYAASMLTDVLLEEKMATRNVLVIGEKVSGKSCLLRDVIRLTSSFGVRTACVDTYGELGGSGWETFGGLGECYRVVPKLGDQAAALMESVVFCQPETVVIDEIVEERESSAVRFCARKGVRVIAGVSGKLQDIGGNDLLKGVLGVGAGGTVDSLFDMIVEIVSFDQWRIIENVNKSVESVLKGEGVPFQVVRTRDRGSLGFRMQFVGRAEK